MQQGWAQAPTAVDRGASEVAPGYLLKQWGEDDGLPLGTIEALQQTPDGYLWLATENGLVRFDGHRFTIYSPANTSALQSSRIQTIDVDDRGRLWAFTDRLALVRYEHGIVESAYGSPGTRTSIVSKETGARRLILAADTVWLATDDGVMQQIDGQWQAVVPGQLQGTPWALFRDQQHRLWVGMYSGHVYTVAPSGEVERYGAAEGLPNDDQIRGFVEDGEGAIWVRYRGGLYRLGDAGTFEHMYVNRVGHDKRFPNVRLHPQTGQHYVIIDSTGWQPMSRVDQAQGLPARTAPLSRKLEARDRADGTYRFIPKHARVPLLNVASWPVWDHEGNAWTYAGTGVQRNGQPVVDLGSPITALLIDEANNVWLASGAGLAQLRATPFVTPLWSRQQKRKVTALTQARDGTLWAALGRDRSRGFPVSQLVRWTNDHVRNAPLYLGNRVQFQGPRYIPNKNYQRRVGPGDDIWHLYFDPNDQLRVGTNFQPCLVQGQTCTVEEWAPVPANLYENAAAMHHDRAGRFWVATKWGLIVGWPQEEGGYHWQRFTTEDGLPVFWLRTLLETQEGHLLLATSGGGLVRIDSVTAPPASGRDGHVRFSVLNQAHGLPSNMVGALHEDAESAVWMGLGNGAMCRLAEQQRGRSLAETPMDCLTQEAGVSSASVYQLVSDDYGRLWSATSQGINWLAKADIEAVFEGHAGQVIPVQYTEEDGLPSKRVSSIAHPVALKAQDGTLWFATEGGVAQIDPRELDLPVLPRAHIEAIEVGGQRFDLRAPVLLPPGERDVQVYYTGIVFQHTDDVHFRGRMVGYDDAWRDLGQQRTASYTNLAPGTYTFEVQAGLGGQWSPSAQRVLVRAPLVWETRWFYGLLGGLGVLGLVGLWRYRVRHLEAQQVALEGIVAERTTQIQDQATQLERQAHALERANTLKTHFLANISHEFRTPLTLTLGPIQDLLHGHYTSLEEAQPHFERANRNGQRLLRLINQLLDLAKLDAGGLVLRPQSTDVAALVRGVAALFQSVAQRRRIALTVQAPPVRPFVGDPDHIEKIVVNLLSNAFKFTAEGGAITVAVAGAGEMLILTVADTGVGIPEAALPHLFDRFYQVDGSTQRTSDGTGIGLALVKELAVLHSGTVTVESREGEGTCFEVVLHSQKQPDDENDAIPTLPALSEGMPALHGDGGAPVEEMGLWDDDSVAALAQATSGARVADDDAMVVLLVEDHADLRAYIRSHLDPAFTLLEAADGQAGLALAQTHVPDLILSDVMMPRMDGLDLLDALRADRRTSHIPVVLLTARADVESRMAGFERGAEGYVPKPFHAGALQAQVRALIEQRQRLQQVWATTSTSQLDVNAGPDYPALPEREQQFVDEVDAVLHANLAQSQFTMDDLADAMTLTPRQLRRKLRALTHERPNERMRRFRLEAACRALQQQPESIKVVAFEAGFGSVAYFSKQFKAAYGMTPTAYRAQHQA
ncbi:MAG: ATP-binding protein [Bacteroidota bacterium]